MKNKHNQKVGSTVERSDDRIRATGEVFTPMDLVYQMVNEIPLETLTDPSSTFLDNSAGSGNFLYGLLTVLEQYHSREHILDNMLYCVRKNQTTMLKSVNVWVFQWTIHIMCVTMLCHMIIRSENPPV